MGLRAAVELFCRQHRRLTLSSRAARRGPEIQGTRFGAEHQGFPASFPRDFSEATRKLIRSSGSGPARQHSQQRRHRIEPPGEGAALRLPRKKRLQAGISFEAPGPAAQGQMQITAQNGNDTILVFDFRYHRVGLGSGVASTSTLTSSSRYNPAVPVGSV